MNEEDKNLKDTLNKWKTLLDPKGENKTPEENAAILKALERILSMDTKQFENPNPDCINECNFIPSDCGTVTNMYFPPSYDKNGVNTNPDGNIHTSFVSCGTCGKKWTSETQYGKTIYTEKTS